MNEKICTICYPENGTSCIYNKNCEHLCHQPQEEKWCPDCKKMAGEKHCCFNFTECPQEPIKCQIRQPHYSCSDCKEEEKPPKCECPTKEGLWCGIHVIGYSPENNWEIEFDKKFATEDLSVWNLREEFIQELKDFIRQHKERWEKGAYDKGLEIGISTENHRIWKEMEEINVTHYKGAVFSEQLCNFFFEKFRKIINSK